MRIVLVRHALTQQNVDNIRYDNFGENEVYHITDEGKKHAKTTGKYLHDVFGKFDCIYVSPRHRCIETAKIIADEIKYAGEFISDTLLQEGPAGKYNLKTREEIKAMKSKNKNLVAIDKKISDTNNPFDIAALIGKYNAIEEKFAKQESLEKLYKNCKVFLKKIVKNKHSQILIVAHSGTMSLIQSIITNTSVLDSFTIAATSYLGDKKMIFKGSCFMMYVV